MATSGSTNLSYTKRQVCEAALRKAGVLGRGFTMSNADYSFAGEALDLIVKQWMGTADFAPGLKEWSRKIGYLFLQKDQVEYTVGPNGDHATTAFTQTKLTANAAVSATSLTVDSISGISNGQFIGITLDSGSIHWTTVNGAPSGSTVTITTGLTGAAASGKRVIAYTSKISKPLEIITMVRRDSTDNMDSTMNPMTVYDYEGIGNKSASGTPSAYFYEEGRTDGTMKLNQSPDDVAYILRFTFWRPIEDLDASTDEVDYPQQWFRALVGQLALDMLPEYSKPLTEETKLFRDDGLSIARHGHAETTDVSFQPEAS